eukprot:605203-Prorocentrum_minimum.AAC.1
MRGGGGVPSPLRRQRQQAPAWRRRRLAGGLAGGLAGVLRFAAAALLLLLIGGFLLRWRLPRGGLRGEVVHRHHAVPARARRHLLGPHAAVKPLLSRSATGEFNSFPQLFAARSLSPQKLLRLPPS